MIATAAIADADLPYYVQMLEAAPAGLALADRRGIRFVNRALEFLSGLSAIDMVGKPATSLLHSDSADVAVFVERFLARPVERPFRSLMRFRSTDGSSRYADVLLATLASREPAQPPALMMRFGPPADASSQWLDPSDVTRRIVEATPAAMFVLNEARIVTHWNHALQMLTGVPASRIVGTRDVWKVFHDEHRPLLGELLLTGEIESAAERNYQGKFRRSPRIPGAYEAEDFFPRFGSHGRWLSFTVAPLRNHIGQVVGSITSLFDVTEAKMAESALVSLQVELEVLIDRRTEQLASAHAALELDLARRQETERQLLARNAELSALNLEWTRTQEALLQAEKMASVGQLAAGVAHEINNPIGYVHSNIGTLDGYLDDLFTMIGEYQTLKDALPVDHPARLRVCELEQSIDLTFVRADVPNLMSETREGITRVRKIVQDLKDFSRSDRDQDWETCDLRRNLDSSLNIVANEIKYHADVERVYDDIPLVQCRPSQISQVFLNLLVNAAHAIEGGPRGLITIGARRRGDSVVIDIADNGRGIPKDVMPRIFDPFFTTKPVGKGTGLGLSLSYSIVQKHGGMLQVDSEVGRGTTFSLVLPIVQPRPEDEA